MRRSKNTFFSFCLPFFFSFPVEPVDFVVGMGSFGNWNLSLLAGWSMAPCGFCYIWAGHCIRREVVLETEGVWLAQTPTDLSSIFLVVLLGNVWDSVSVDQGSSPLHSKSIKLQQILMQQNSLQVVLGCNNWFIQPKMLAEPISVAAPDPLQGKLISVGLRLCLGCVEHLRWAIETPWLCLLLLMILITACSLHRDQTIGFEPDVQCRLCWRSRDRAGEE